MHPQRNGARSTDHLDTAISVIDEQPWRALDRLEPVGSLDPLDIDRVGIRSPAAGKVGDGLEFVAEPVQAGRATQPSGSP